MILCIGLGNPGKKYEQSRHNLGFQVIDQMAAMTEVGAWKTQSEALVAKSYLDGAPFMLVKPQTFMNNSGKSVAGLLNFYKIPLDQLLVVVDDLDLDLGKLRHRNKGSDGGHRGLRSIIQWTGSEEFKRVRIGIGKPGSKSSVISHVLGSNKEEQGTLDQVAEIVARQALDFIRTGEFENWSTTIS